MMVAWDKLICKYYVSLNHFPLFSSCHLEDYYLYILDLGVNSFINHFGSLTLTRKILSIFD